MYLPLVSISLIQVLLHSLENIVITNTWVFCLFGFWTSDLNKLDKSGQTGAWVRETLEEATKTGTLGSFSAAPLVKGSLDGLIKSALEESAPPGETTALSWETVGSCAVGLVV